MPKTHCDFCENRVFFINENNEAYCLNCCIEANEEQPLESAVAVDFNSSAASKDGGFLERLG